MDAHSCNAGACLLFSGYFRFLEGDQYSAGGRGMPGARPLPPAALPGSLPRAVRPPRAAGLILARCKAAPRCLLPPSGRRAGCCSIMPTAACLSSAPTAGQQAGVVPGRPNRFAGPNPAFPSANPLIPLGDMYEGKLLSGNGLTAPNSEPRPGAPAARLCRSAPAPTARPSNTADAAGTLQALLGPLPLPCLPLPGALLVPSTCSWSPWTLQKLAGRCNWAGTTLPLCPTPPATQTAPARCNRAATSSQALVRPLPTPQPACLPARVPRPVHSRHALHLSTRSPLVCWLCYMCVPRALPPLPPPHPPTHQPRPPHTTPCRLPPRCLPQWTLARTSAAA
jgi:hypothetical protein